MDILYERDLPVQTGLRDRLPHRGAELDDDRLLVLRDGEEEHLAQDYEDDHEDDARNDLSHWAPPFFSVIPADRKSRRGIMFLSDSSTT